MSYRAVCSGLLAAFTVAACGAPAPPPDNEPTPAASEDVELIEGEESAEYERVAQISMLVFGSDARGRIVDRARTRAAELGADALSFKLYPVTRPPAPPEPVRQRHSYAGYSFMPLLRARVSCSVIERTGDRQSKRDQDRVGALPDCSDLDDSLRAYSIEVGRRTAVPARDRGYILIGWALQRRPERLRKRSDV